MLEWVTTLALRAAWKLRGFTDDYADTYREKNPLSKGEKRAILFLYLRGDPLCCTKGEENLKHILRSPCWVRWINEWAYECLGCDGDWKPGGRLFKHGEEKLLKLLNLEGI